MHIAIREDSGSYHVGYRVFLLSESKKCEMRYQNIASQAKQNSQDTKSNCLYLSSPWDNNKS